MNKILNFFSCNYDPNFSGKVMIRENSSQEILLVIEGDYSYIQELLKEDIENVIYNDQVLIGKEYFIETIRDYQFKVHYQSFFQINRKGLEAIYHILEKFSFNNLKTTLDLYSGTSVLGIFLSKISEKVFSIEENEFAISAPRKLRRSYLLTKKIKLAIYKIITYVPRLISGNYKKSLN